MNKKIGVSAELENSRIERSERLKGEKREENVSID